MTQPQNSGYIGKTLETLKKASCEVGDIIEITSEGKRYEGILMPRSEIGNYDHVVVKLKSGYNIGIRLASNATVNRVGKGTKPTFASPPIPEQRADLPRVSIMSTGGTIASRVDYRTGAVRSALAASDLYGVVPELSDIAKVDTKILLSLYSENITPRHWGEIASAVAAQIKSGVDGVVIAHGTDTMAYTSAALSFALQNLPVPVVVVGAQRSSDRPSSDAATNLVGAVQFAVNGPFAEVVLAMHESASDTGIVAHRGTKVRKCHTSRRDTFKSINAFPIARVKENEIAMLVTDFRKRNSRNQLVLKQNFSEDVTLIKFHPGFNPSVIDWYVEKGCKGIILEGTGLGHVSKYCFDAIENARAQGVVVALTSQCIWGRVNMHVYDTGRDLLNLGVIPLDDMLPETGLVKLMWALGQTSTPQEVKKLLTTNIAGEFSPRTLPQEATA
jgi:glutamyl-tRNA(Gln) amidotransferase subunit D